LTHAAIYDYHADLVISILLSPATHAAVYDYRQTQVISYYYRLDTPQFVIIALNLVLSILLSPRHTRNYDYRLEPGDIVIIALTRRNL
jgi:hypothetical protein